jgi:hypothetical protein
MNIISNISFPWKVAIPTIAHFSVGLSTTCFAFKAAYWIADQVNLEIEEKYINKGAFVAGTIATISASFFMQKLGMTLGLLLQSHRWSSVSFGIFAAAIAAKYMPKPDYDESTEYNISHNCVEEATKNQILPQNGVAVIYGFDHCLYSSLRYTFGIYKNVKPFFDEAAYEEAEGLSQEDNLLNQARKCKDYLVNTLLENYRRSQKKDPEKPLIPIVFCIDVKDNPFPLTAENILSKTKIIKNANGESVQASKIMTHRELRRAFKLCYSKNLPEDFKAIARQSFKFVRIEFEDSPSKICKPIEDGVFEGRFRAIERTFTRVVKVNAPWEKEKEEDWKEQWKAHTKKSRSKTVKEDWRLNIKLRVSLIKKIAASSNATQ